MEYRYLAKRRIKKWRNCSCDEITQDMVEKFLLERKRVPAFTANKDLRYLRATFNFGKKKRLAWDDVNLDTEHVTVYTRKERGGNLAPRQGPMTEKLFEILSRRFENRDRSKPWGFWHRWWDERSEKWQAGPFNDRHKIMRPLCKKAGVRYLRFHALRHAGASMLELNNISIGTIQRILGHENRTTTEIYLHFLSGVPIGRR